MHNTKPHSLSEGEWREIARVPLVRKRWGIPEGENGAVLPRVIYGAHFDFVSSAGALPRDLYILQGNALTDEPPVVLVRETKTRRLVVASEGG